MGEYEPEDSRHVTQSTHQAPGEPPRTGPREDEARARAKPKEPEDKDKPTARSATVFPFHGTTREYWFSTSERPSCNCTSSM